MRAQTIFCLAALCLLGACNQPAVSLKAPAFQSSENTVRDWNDVAHEIAAQMAAHGLLPPVAPEVSSAPYVAKPVFIHVQALGSAFAQQVATELRADILARGAIVARNPVGATVINLDVDFVKWSPRDKPPGLTGSVAAVEGISGVVVAASLPMSTWTAADAAASGAAGFGILSDALIALTPLSNSEAVWKASVVTDDQVVLSLQKPIYIRDRDISLYAKTADLTPVASWTDANEPLTARPLRLAP